LNFGILTMFAGLADGAIGIVGEMLVVNGQHVGFRNQVECLWDSKNFDCTKMWSAEAKSKQSSTGQIAYRAI
jgi:hypothetical protein